MSHDKPVVGSGWTPPFVQPIMQALDRIEERQAFRPEQLTERARRNLESLGSSPRSVESTFAHGALGLAANHTLFFDGFALLKPIRDGIAVAIRESDLERSQVVFEGDDRVWEFDANEEDEPLDGAPWWVRLVARLVHRVHVGDGQVDVSVVSTVVSSCEDAYGAALSMATVRTLQSMYSVVTDGREITVTCTESLAASTGRPWTEAYAIAADVATVGEFVLVDTQTGRRLTFAPPAASVAGWGLVDVPVNAEPATSFDSRRMEVSRITERLHKKHFPTMESLRDLEHKDLERAEQVVSRSQRPLLRHLVRENQRVQRMVTASRKGDWQLFGALLLMSHASHRSELGETSEEADFVVDAVEDASVSGMYGAKAIGSKGAIVIVGQSFIVPTFLDTLGAGLEERFGKSANAVLL